MQYTEEEKKDPPVKSGSVWMPGKEKKNAGVWQPVPPDRPAATNKRMAMGIVLPTLGITFRSDQWENMAAE